LKPPVTVELREHKESLEAILEYSTVNDPEYITLNERTMSIDRAWRIGDPEIQEARHWLNSGKIYGPSQPTTPLEINHALLNNGLPHEQGMWGFDFKGNPSDKALGHFR
jgi:hypothetical protein